MKDSWIGSKEASMILRCDPSHLRRMARDGKLRRNKRVLKHRETWMYNRDEVEALRDKERAERRGKLTFHEAIIYLKKKGITHASKANIYNWRRKGWIKAEISKYYAQTLFFDPDNLDDFISVHGKQLKGEYRVPHKELNMLNFCEASTLRSSIISAVETAKRDPYLGLAQAILTYLMGDYAYALEMGNKAQIQYFEVCIRTDYFYNLTLQKVSPEDVIKTYRARYGVEEG